MKLLIFKVPEAGETGLGSYMKARFRYRREQVQN